MELPDCGFKVLYVLVYILCPNSVATEVSFEPIFVS